MYSGKIKLSNPLLLGVFIFLISFSHGVNAQSQEIPRNEKLEILIKNSQLDQADSLLNELFKKTPISTSWRVYYLTRKSQVLLNKGLFKESLATAKESTALLPSLPESVLYGETYRAMCFAYIRTGKLDSALTIAEKLYDLSKRLDNSNLRRGALIAMGNISLQNRKNENSLNYYLEALELSQRKGGDSLNLKVDLYNVGLAYASLKENETSNDYLKKAAVRAEKEGDKRLLARIYGTLSDNQLRSNQNSEHIFYLKKANELALELGDFQLLAMGSANLTESYILGKNYPEAIKQGLLAISYLEKRPSIQIHSKVDSLLYVSYKRIGDPSKALEQLELYDQKKGTIRGQAQKEKLDELTLAFEVEKKDLLIQNQEIEIREEKVKTGLFLVTISGLILVIGLMVYMKVKDSKTRFLFFRKEKELDFQAEQLSILKAATFAKQEKLPAEILPLIFEEEISKNPNQMLAELLDLIEEKRMYLDPAFSQKSLVAELGTNRQYLYEAINSSGEENFRTMINRFRVNFAKKKIESELKQSIKTNLTKLYEVVGFNSYRTFFRAFKSITGLTPNEYIDEYKKELIIRQN
jgi:AraC-like DNA-binding protein